MKVECAVQEQLHKWGGPMDSDNLTPLEQETSKRVWNNQEWSATTFPYMKTWNIILSLENSLHCWFLLEYGQMRLESHEKQIH